MSCEDNLLPVLQPAGANQQPSCQEMDGTYLSFRIIQHDSLALQL
jgi:hypothetical protein